jgi:putative phosphoribosyl transferase
VKPDAIVQGEQMAALVRTTDTEIPVGVSLPAGPRGLIVFGDGIGSGLHGSENQRVSKILNQGGFATVLSELSGQEQVLNCHTGEICGGISLLEQRVVAITDWIAMQPSLKRMPMGYFGIGIGGEAALIAAAKRPEMAGAVVLCEARADTVGSCLEEILAPTLFIVGSEDPELVERQHIAINRLPASTVSRLEIIESGRELLNNPGVVDRIAAMAQSWYESHICNAEEMTEDGLHSSISAGRIQREKGVF